MVAQTLTGVSTSAIVRYATRDQRRSLPAQRTSDSSSQPGSISRRRSFGRPTTSRRSPDSIRTSGSMSSTSRAGWPAGRGPGANCDGARRTPRPGGPRRSESGRTVTSATWRRSSATGKAASTSPVSAVNARRGADRAETLSAVTFGTALPSRVTRFWLNIRRTMRAVGASRRTSRAARNVDQVVAGGDDDTGGLADAGLGQDRFVPAVAADRRTPASRGSAGSAARSTTVTGTPAVRRQSRTRQPDAAEAAQQDRAVHACPPDGTTDGFRICGGRERLFAGRRKVSEPDVDFGVSNSTTHCVRPRGRVAPPARRTAL